MNANHTVGGIFNGPLNPSSCNLTISGTGTIITAAGAQGYDTGGSTPGSTTFNVPLSGASQIQIQGAFNYLAFTGNSSGWSGGFLVTSGSGWFVGGNNNNPMGTGSVSTSTTLVIGPQCLNDGGTYNFANAFALGDTNVSTTWLMSGNAHG